MRKFVCTQCGHKFDVASCNGQRGWQISCPQCNSPVQRINFGQGPGMGQGLSRQGGRTGGRGQRGNWCISGRSGQRGCFGIGGGRGQGLGKGRGLQFGSDGNSVQKKGNIPYGD